MAAPRKVAEQDFVKEQGKLVAQVKKERETSKEWQNYWGFLKDKNKLLENEAALLGWNKEEYWTAVQSVESSRTSKPAADSSNASNSDGRFPRTTNEMYGWRNQSLESIKYFPMIEPVQVPEKQNIIFLG